MTGKKLSIHTIHGEVEKIFNCLQANFLKEVSLHYKLPEHEIRLYDIEKKEFIPVYNLRDMIHVEIVGREEILPSVNSRRLRSSEGQSSKALTPVEIIIKKLRENTTLNGTERKFLVETLEKYDSPSSGTLKRKRSEDNGIINKKQTSNKKLQVCVQNVKDSFAQTDEVYKVVEKTNTDKKKLIERMKLIAASGAYHEDEVCALMFESYDERRTFFVIEKPPVSVMKEKYPLLFSVNEVKNELERLFCKGKCETFLLNISKYAETIYKLKENDDDEVSKKTKKYKERGKTDQQKNYAQDVGSLLMIPYILDEKITFIKTLDNLIDPGIYPYISAETTTIKDLFFDQSLFKVVVEDVQLCEASNFKEAVLCLMASYFIFNIQYPDYSPRTYVVFEKLYLEANDTDQIDKETQQLLNYLNFNRKDNI